MSDDYVRKDLFSDIKEKQAEYERRHERSINYIGLVITVCGVIVAAAQLYLALKG